MCIVRIFAQCTMGKNYMFKFVKCVNENSNYYVYHNNNLIGHIRKRKFCIGKPGWIIIDNENNVNNNEMHPIFDLRIDACEYLLNRYNGGK